MIKGGLLLLTLAMALPLQASDAGSIALMVSREDLNAATIGEAISSTDALTRATAARVALVRDLKTLVAPLRAALKNEKNPTAAVEGDPRDRSSRLR